MNNLLPSPDSNALSERSARSSWLRRTLRLSQQEAGASATMTATGDNFFNAFAIHLQASAMVFPRYARDEPQRLSPRRRTDSFILAAYHSFNYSLLCEAGFDAMKMLIESIDCFDLVYHDLEWAVNSVNDLPGLQADP